MSLGLETFAPPQTRDGQHIAVEEVRELTERDLEVQSLEPPAQPSALKRITQRHRTLARLIADGMPTGEAAIVSGYAPATVSHLKNDPSFKELVRHFVDAKEQVYYDMHDGLAHLGAEAVEELRHRLENAPEEISNSMLRDIITTTTDRTGHGPQTHATNEINVNLGIAERMAQAAKVIEGRAEVVSDEAA